MQHVFNLFTGNKEKCRDLRILNFITGYSEQHA